MLFILPVITPLGPGLRIDDLGAGPTAELRSATSDAYDLHFRRLHGKCQFRSNMTKRGALVPSTLLVASGCELLKERSLEIDQTTVWRWLQRYGPELEERLRRHLKADLQIVACGREVHSSEGPLVLPVSGHRFRRR
jgi:hypothetical protein